MTAVSEKSIEEQIRVSFLKLQKAIPERRTEPLKHRKERLLKLRDWIHNNRSLIHEAMYADFNKPAVEVDAIELFHVLNEIKLAVNNLGRWAQPKQVDAPITMLGTRSVIRYEPKGVCLIISPWNYPFSLTAGPLVSALAAGNAVMLKPSELTPHVAALLRKMVTAIFDPGIVSLQEGGPEVSQYLLKLPFDHIFFTGSPGVGKLVMKAAAENLTSVTLELGGKSPTIVTDTANIKDAAQRIAVAKFVNNGQTCIAPDYVLADAKIVDHLIPELIRQTTKLFGDNGSFMQSASYARIVNDRHFARLNELLQDALDTGARLELGGESDRASRFFHPAIVTNVGPEARIMEEEIFGPILPIITYQRLDEAIAIINGKPKPLALYIFTHRGDVSERILETTSAGGVCINDCGIQFLHHNLPFGGVNNSGIGKSHGHYGFLAFSNEKPVLKQKNGLTSVRAFYPPYTAWSAKLMDWFLKLF